MERPAVDTALASSTVSHLATKRFEDMTLDEIFAFEAAHSFNIGRRVVSLAGIRRHRRGTAKMLTRIVETKEEASVRKTTASQALRLASSAQATRHYRDPQYRAALDKVLATEAAAV